MNESITQYCPVGLTCKHHVLNYSEIDELYLKLQIIKYKKNKDGIYFKQYGYCYDEKNDTIDLIQKIPKTLADCGKCLISRLGLKMRFNHIDVKIYSDTQYVAPCVDDANLGDQILFLVIGDMFSFKMVNLKNSKKTYGTTLYNGSCLYLEDESRYLWIYSTIPMFGNRYIITFRDIPQKKKSDHES